MDMARPQNHETEIVHLHRESIARGRASNGSVFIWWKTFFAHFPKWIEACNLYITKFVRYVLHYIEFVDEE